MKSSLEDLREEFLGYPPATSNYTCTPNQFFEVVLPYSSRGTARIVGYMIRQILGWSDAAGNPKRPQLSFSYNELIERAGVSRSMIRPALDEAISRNFIRCIRNPKSASYGEQSISGLYELSFDDSGEYGSDPDNFRGFFSGEGRFTPTPNRYFDYTLLEESLSVAKLVGVIIRNTIGFQTKFGLRRQEVALSYEELLKKTQLSRGPLAEAIKLGLEKGHLVRTAEGSFSHSPKDRRKASYGIRWTDEEAVRKADQELTGSKSEPAGQFENQTKSSLKTEPGTVRKPDQKQFENQTTIKKENGTQRQQQRAAAEDGLLFELIRAGFDEKFATTLTHSHGEEKLRSHLRLLDSRKGLSNPAGFLRRSLEENWTPRAAPPERVKIPAIILAQKVRPSSEMLENLRQKKPALWEEFLQADAECERTLLVSPLISREMQKRLHLEFQSSGAKLKRFADYLERRGPIQDRKVSGN